MTDSMCRIFEEYAMNWIIDGLPASQIYRDDSTKELFYIPGIPLGEISGDVPALHNHYNIHVKYHSKDATRIRIVGVVVNPAS
jgi:transmembrane 9 superfamily protein 2/4